jgi:ABC-type multidrug transport system fused ATPase/permease subunit
MALLIANTQPATSATGAVGTMMCAMSSFGVRECRGLGFANSSSRWFDRKRIVGHGVSIPYVIRSSIRSPIRCSIRKALRDSGIQSRAVRSRGLVCEASSAESALGIVDSGREFNGAPVWSYVIPLRRTFPLIEPFLVAEIGLILRGWVCTAVAVGALFLTVPQIGNLSNLLAKGDMQQLFPKAGQVLALVMVRSVAQFWQQAFLWEAALKITYQLRAHVYARVLKRDMDYFEGGEGGAAAGDVAFRLTAEAEDVGDTVHSLLHVSDI